MLNTPILFLVFNRPDTTQQVFAKIREIQPKQLFVAADGARAGKEGEEEKVAQVRKLILEGIDWNCEVKTLFREENLGCGKAVSSAITWFFEQVEEGIILEDDCLPNNSFFRFCEELLDYYRDDGRIMHISGNNFQFGKKVGNASYYFSKYNHIWGWATWKRAWEIYDYELKDFQDRKNEISYPKKTEKYWKEVFLGVSDKKIDTWDYQWTYCMWKKNGLSILPNKNLISNIGFGFNATHTKDSNSIFGNIPTQNISFPLIHPKNILVSNSADRNTSKKIFSHGKKHTIIVNSVKKKARELMLFLKQNKM